MKSKTTGKLSILLNIVLIVFFIVYFLVPFSATGFWATVFSPLCQITSVFQGDDYVPGWCLLKEGMKNEVNSNVNTNVNTNGNVNTNLNTNVNSNLNDNTNVNANLNSNTNTGTGIANPAAVKCKDEGGTSEAFTKDGGEAALCVFSDKSICEEWAYFRLECRKGQCHKECRKIGTANEGWYNSCTGDLLKTEKCGAATVTSPRPTATSGNISVSAPIANDQLSSPIQVVGRAKTADNKIYARVKSKSGQTLIDFSGSMKNVGTDGYGDFSLKISYEFSTTKEGTIEIFGKDGETEVGLVSIPVKF
ncbi:MAG: DUF333 domain-containing protein [Candidatus Parcubacteria bacterium]|nr:DUF333 domain-containing protein [Candidatus Parcubacteria bacterium]